MTKELVFIPIARDELAAIDGSVLLTGRAAHHVTPELLAALEYTAGQEEDAEYAALVLASVAALTRRGGSRRTYGRAAKRSISSTCPETIRISRE